MTINSGDIKFVKTQVMDDVPEGGGSPTSVVIVDGVSNAIMPDVSETDRSLGRVNLRKVGLIVDTANTDTLLGANVIIAEPPADPNISVTMFSTADFFDKRDAAKSRIEAYLSIGVQWPAYLYGNHIAGQDTILMYQKTADLPPIGGTLVLTKREGYSDQVVQYIRVIQASAVLRTFEDDKGTFQRYVVTLKLSTTLAVDFVGFDMSRYEQTKAALALATKISDSVTANAARYYGVAKVAVSGAIGDYTIKADSIFSQLVPSAQVETPIADARTNQVSAAVVAGGATIVQNMTAVFNAANNMFVGGGIAPGSLTIVNGAITVTDSGGRLMSAGSQVGTVDYENGVLALLSDLFGSASLTFTVTYAPAFAPQSVNQSQGFPVTQEGRSQSYVRTIQPAPVRGSLAISYMAQGRWYVLREQGDGSIKGADSGYGAGTLNFSSGTVSVTLGALPDVGSEIIYTWVEPDAARSADVLQLDNNGKLYWLYNFGKAIERGGLTITWPDGGTRTVTDDSAGNLTGYGSGFVDYATGVIRLSPQVLPPPGTTVNITATNRTAATAAVTIAGGNGSFGVSNVTPGSISMDVQGQIKAVYMANPVINWGAAKTYRVIDDGVGNLVLLFGDSRLTVGTVNYAAGTFVLNGSTVIPSAVARIATAWDNIYQRVAGSLGYTRVAV